MIKYCNTQHRINEILFIVSDTLEKDHIKSTKMNRLMSQQILIELNF